MAATPDNPPANESAVTARLQPRRGCTWVPVVVGVLCGCCAAHLLTDSFAAWMSCRAKGIESTVPYKLFWLALATVGGSIGVLFSRPCKRTACFYSLAVLMAVAVFVVEEVPWSEWYCWAFLPTERDAEHAIRQAITKRNQPTRLVSLHKKDEEEFVIDGIKHCRMEYYAEWEITEDCDWHDVRYYGWDVAEFYERGHASFEPMPNEQAKKGDRVRTLGRIGFQKTTNGWRPD